MELLLVQLGILVFGLYAAIESWNSFWSNLESLFLSAQPRRGPAICSPGFPQSRIVPTVNSLIVRKPSRSASASKNLTKPWARRTSLSLTHSAHAGPAEALNSFKLMYPSL